MKAKEDKFVCWRKYGIIMSDHTHRIDITVYDREISEGTSLYVYKTVMSIIEQDSGKPHWHEAEFHSNLGPAFERQWGTMINNAIRAHIIDAQTEFNMSQNEVINRFYHGLDIGLCFRNAFMSYCVINSVDNSNKNAILHIPSGVTMGTAEVK